MRGRLAIGAALALAGALALAAPAAAHGLSGRADLPVPAWLFSWAVAVVLVLSFVALGALWRRPALAEERWRPLPGGIGRVLGSRPVELAAGATGALLLGLVVWSGLGGEQDNPAANFAPVFVYVVFWVGLVFASVLFGDLFHAFNPWRALGRAAGWLTGRALGARLPAPLPYPARLGRWPAVAGLAAFAWLELVSAEGATPRTVALAALAYTGLTCVAMALFGIETWIGRGEAFAFYFNLFSRLSPLARRGAELGLRRPLSGLAGVEPLSGTAAFVAIMIGAVTFDGLEENPLWRDLRPRVESAFSSLGLGGERAGELAGSIGLLAAIIVIYGLYRLGVAGAERAGSRGEARLAAVFAPSLVPIALAYVGAHYLTLLLYQGQAIVPLASDPLGRGWDLFGTASRSIDYTLIGATTTWYAQVALVVAGHVAALTLAHDRALVLHERDGLAVRSQYAMLAVVVGFTSLALWLLSQANA